MAFHQLLIPQAAGFAQLVFPVLFGKPISAWTRPDRVSICWLVLDFRPLCAAGRFVPEKLFFNISSQCSPRPECISLGSSVTFLS